MDRALRISTILGFVSGGWVLWGITNAPGFLGIPRTINVPIVFFVPQWAFLLIGPLIALVSALKLLFNDMNRDQRGIVGFIAFVASLPAIWLLLIILAAYVTGRPAFPS